MKCYLYAITAGTEYELYVTNDNYSHTYNSVTYAASAMECKEFSFDIKELMGEASVSIPWEQAGFLRNFTSRAIEPIVEIEVYHYNTSTSAASLVFKGFVNSFKVAKAKIDLGCLSFVEQCRDSYPRICLSRHCCRRVYDSGCGLSVGDWTENFTITGISSDGLTITGTGPAHEAEWFTYGYIKSPSNPAGAARYIVGNDYSGSAHSLYLMHPCPTAWYVNQIVTVTAGCDKSTTTCSSKFNNYANFLGFPFAPYESIRYTGLRTETVEKSKK